MGWGARGRSAGPKGTAARGSLTARRGRPVHVVSGPVDMAAAVCIVPCNIQKEAVMSARVQNLNERVSPPGARGH